MATTAATPTSVRQRPKPDSVTTAAIPLPSVVRNAKAQKLALARRGFRSLAIAIAIPVAIAALSIANTGPTMAHMKPTWTPPVWAFHMASISTSFLLGFSAWLVWAEGGFHSQAVVLVLYLAELAMGLLWAPIVFKMGALRVGLAVCATHFVLLFVLSQKFRQVNPIAGDLVKPYLVWVSFLAVFNYKLL